MRKASRYLGNALFLLIVLTGLFILIFSTFFDWRFDAVTTGSMEPAYKVGGAVVIRPVNTDTVEVGDVITFKAPIEYDPLITHRVVEVINNGNELSFKTKGDANKEGDGIAIPSENVRGQVCLYVPFIGYLVEFLKTPFGLVLCLVLPGILMVWLEGRKITAIIGSIKKRRKTTCEENY